MAKMLDLYFNKKNKGNFIAYLIQRKYCKYYTCLKGCGSWYGEDVPIRHCHMSALNYKENFLRSSS
jgi:hypothetical protein